MLVTPLPSLKGLIERCHKYPDLTTSQMLTFTKSFHKYREQYLPLLKTIIDASLNYVAIPKYGFYQYTEIKDGEILLYFNRGDSTYTPYEISTIPRVLLTPAEYAGTTPALHWRSRESMDDYPLDQSALRTLKNILAMVQFLLECDMESFAIHTTEEYRGLTNKLRTMCNSFYVTGSPTANNNSHGRFEGHISRSTRISPLGNRYTTVNIYTPNSWSDPISQSTVVFVDQNEPCQESIGVIPYSSPEAVSVTQMISPYVVIAHLCDILSSPEERTEHQTKGINTIYLFLNRMLRCGIDYFGINTLFSQKEEKPLLITSKHLP